MDSWLVCIAGGSGSGKSTLAVGLYKKYPDLITVVGLDDYYKSAEEAPRKGKWIDWETPDALNFDQLVEDLEALLAGAVVYVRSKHELYNPGYRPELRNKVQVPLFPRRIILLEGYLALYDPRVRKLMELGIYLEADIRKTVHNRTRNKAPQTQEYFEEILFPAHRKYVEPTEQFAGLVIYPNDTNAEQVLSLAENTLQSHYLLPA